MAIALDPKKLYRLQLANEEVYSETPPIVYVENAKTCSLHRGDEQLRLMFTQYGPGFIGTIADERQLDILTQIAKARERTDARKN